MVTSLIRHCRTVAIAGALVSASVGLLPVQAQQPPTRISARAQEPQPRINDTQHARSLRARWRAQQILARKAEAEYHKARLAREIAEIAMADSEDEFTTVELATADGEIKLAEADLKRADDRIAWARRMFDKGYINMAAKVSEELNLKKAVFSLEQAQTKRKVLVEYSKPKTLATLKAELDKAHADELAEKAKWDREKAKEAELERAAVDSRAGNPNPPQP